MKIRPFVFLALIALILPIGFPATLSATHYVSASGGNIFPYDSWGKASHTIQAAVTACSTSDVLMIGAGTYSPETGEVFPIVITEGQDSITVIGIDGAIKTVIDAKSTGAVLSLNLFHRALLRGITIRGGLGNGVAVSGPGAGYVTLEGCRMLNNGGSGVFGELGAGFALTNCIVSTNGGCGINNLEGPTHIRDCSITSNGGTGVQGMDLVEIEDSRISANGDKGVTGRSLSLVGTEPPRDCRRLRFVRG